MPSNDFRLSLDSSRAKLWRAKDHLDAIQEYITTTFREPANRPLVGSRFDSETAYHTLYVKTMPDLRAFEIRLGVMIGDVIHNLRSSLDHLVYQLALWPTRGARPDSYRRLQFPITDSPNSFWRECDEFKRLDGLFPVDVADIERMQPYNKTNLNGIDTVPLKLLQEMSNVDKHRSINTVMAVQSMTEVEMPFGFTFMRNNLDLRPIGRAPLKEGSEFMRVKQGGILVEQARSREPEADANVTGRITPGILLARNHQRAVPSIRMVLKTCADIAQYFDERITFRNSLMP